MKILLALAACAFLSSTVWAETVNLKDGRTVSGKILQQDATQVKIDSNGIATTYFVDEIKDIDGKVLNAPEAATPSPAPVTKKIVSPVPQFPYIKADDPVEKRTLILKFIDVFGTRRALSRNFEAMLSALEDQKPEEAQKIRNRFKIDEVIERLIPLYDKHFTSDDLKAFIEFYSSSKGKKLIFSIGEIMKESVQVSSDYIREKFPEMGSK